MPSLVLHLQKIKTKPGAGYTSSFSRNLHERTDQPCFSFEDALDQLKNPTYGSKLIEIEKEMDNFFLTYLPQDIIEVHGVQNKEIDEYTMKQVKMANMNLKKDKTYANFENNAPKKSNRPGYNQINPEDSWATELQNTANKRRNKSDLTLGFINSGQLVEQIADDSKKELMINIERNKMNNQLGALKDENSEISGLKRVSVRNEKKLKSNATTDQPGDDV